MFTLYLKTNFIKRVLKMNKRNRLKKFKKITQIKRNVFEAMFHLQTHTHTHKNDSSFRFDKAKKENF